MPRICANDRSLPEKGPSRSLGAALLLLTFFCNDAAWAGLVDDSTWSADSADGRYRLVMLAGEDNPSAEATDLAKRYAQDGVYLRSEDGDELLWETPPLYRGAYDARFSDDGMHVLLGQPNSASTLHNPDPPFRPYEASFLFLHGDRPSQHWREQELTRGFLVKRAVSRFLLRRDFDRWRIAPAAPSRVAITNVGEEHVFDLTTGRRVRVRSVWDAAVAAFLIGVPPAFLVARRGRARAAARRSRFQVSLAELTLLATTVAGLLALGRCGWGLSAATAGVGLVGATVAWLIGRRRGAAWAGAWLAVYGAALGLTLFAVVVEPILWWRVEASGPPFPGWLLLGCFYGLLCGGPLVGAVAGGVLLRRA